MLITWAGMKRSAGKLLMEAPDWIIEILSPSTSTLYVKDKFLLYEKYGVKEYWIVEPSNKIVFVSNLGSDNLYKKSVNYGADDKIESGVLAGLSVNLTRVFV